MRIINRICFTTVPYLVYSVPVSLLPFYTARFCSESVTCMMVSGDHNNAGADPGFSEGGV